MKVAVAVHGRFHAFELAAQLFRRGLLAGLATTYPEFAARRFLPPGVPLATAPVLEVVRRLHGRLPVLPAPDVWIARHFARFAARTLPAGSDLAVGWSGASLELIPAAQARGLKVAVERGSAHIAHQAELHLRLRETFGAIVPAVPPAMIARECAEYAAADAIAVPTRFAAETFTRRGIDPARLIVNPYGVDLDRFQAVAPRRGGEVLRIVFVGRVGPPKGVPWLLRAFARLGPKTELHLIGPIEPGMDRLFAGEPMARVVVRGPLPGAQLAEEYAAADLFCLPSLHEGLALVILQAMAAGLPVVTTPESGAGDVFTDGVEGRLVPAQDVDRLAEALAALAADAELRRAMGEAARGRVAHGFTWDDYGARAVTAYRALLAGPT
ncbi:MAG: glycosyltransferase [Candidatus Hydrogenedens sp.]|nr:glycosyltransferase [Candidatus Hydrogenedens sp.]